MLAIFEQHKPERPLTGPIKLLMTMHYPHTEGSAKKGTRVVKISKPDWDNIPKIPCDEMVRAGLLSNDANIWDGRLQKFHCDITGIGIDMEETDEIIQ